MGFRPSFFACDKDSAEIAAIGSVFPSVRVQLCYWHVLRAIRSKLGSYKSTQGHLYDPEGALKIIPHLEVCWGSRIDKRPPQHRDPLMCECPSWTDVAYGHAGRLEASSVEERNSLLALIHRHFNYHSKIPFEGGIWKQEDAIHQMCAAEMYSFCRGRNWWRTWVYFWAEWYAPEKWKLWARSVSLEVPVFKTTMILESHWRVLKHDILHAYNRPRMDLVVHCIIRELMPLNDGKMHFLLNRNHRMYSATWRRDFKKDWRAARSTKLGNTVHTTDINQWTCSCSAFVLSRFLLCKHLVKAKENDGPVSPSFSETSDA